MSLIDELLATLPDGLVWDIRVGAFWTAVVAEVGGQSRCGLASTLSDDADHHHGGGPAVREAGMLSGHSARELAGLACSCHPIEAAIGMATINALLPRQEKQWVDLNAGEVIARRGAGKRVALVGHFPFIPYVRERVGALSVLERRPAKTCRRRPPAKSFPGRMSSPSPAPRCSITPSRASWPSAVRRPWSWCWAPARRSRPSCLDTACISSPDRWSRTSRRCCRL
jgi:hypothetical protein